MRVPTRNIAPPQLVYLGEPLPYTVTRPTSYLSLRLFAEDLSDAARRMAEAETTLLAPGLILVECPNVTWQRVRTGAVPLAQAEAVLAALPRWFDTLTPAGELYERAFRVAHGLGHPVCDCLYLALAERGETSLVTADETSVRRVADSRWRDRVEGLGAG